MPNLAYQRGRAFEYQVIKILEKENYLVLRSAGSHTKIDVFAILVKDGEEKPIFRAIQCKRGSSPFKKDLQAIKKLNLPKIISKEIWIKKQRREIEVIIVQ